MKQLIYVLGALVSFSVSAQSNNDLTKHYQAYYAQMKKQGDVQGVINALTHLNVLKPDKGRTDTLAYLYANGRNYIQALNTLGIDKKATDSDLAVEVKAISLKAMNQLPRAIEHYEELNKRTPNPYLAYELADLKIQTNDTSGAAVHVTYGLANAKDDMKRAFYETQQPYEVGLKAAFTYLKGLIELRKDQNNLDAAMVYINQALNMDPNFNMARISRDALENRKKQAAAAASKN